MGPTRTDGAAAGTGLPRGPDLGESSPSGRSPRVPCGAGGGAQQRPAPAPGARGVERGRLKGLSLQRPLPAARLTVAAADSRQRPPPSPAGRPQRSPSPRSALAPSGVDRPRPTRSSPEPCGVDPRRLTRAGTPRCRPGPSARTTLPLGRTPLARPAASSGRSAESPEPAARRVRPRPAHRPRPGPGDPPGCGGAAPPRARPRVQGRVDPAGAAARSRSRVHWERTLGAHEVWTALRTAPTSATGTRAHSRTQAHTLTRARTHSNTHSHSPTHALTHTLTRTHARTLTRTRARAHTHARARIHTLTQAHSRARTHTVAWRHRAPPPRTPKQPWAKASGAKGLGITRLSCRLTEGGIAPACA